LVKLDTAHTTSEATTSSSQTEVPTSAGKGQTKELLQLDKKDWVWPLSFMLSMSMVGLQFPLGYLLAPLIMLARFKSDRYDFLMMFTIFMGGYGLANLTSWGIHSQWLILIAGLFGYLALRKYRLLNRSMSIWVLYAAALIMISTYSIVSLRIQMPKIVRYLTIIYFIIPLLVFAGRDFDIKMFWRRMMPYILLTGIFYIIDCFIFSGNVLEPTTHLWGNRTSTFDHLIWRPLSLSAHRKYPVGVYLFTLGIIPVIKTFRLNKWQWGVIIGGLISTFTFTVMSGFIFVFILFHGKAKQLIKWSFLAIVLFPMLYFVDSFLPARTSGEGFSEVHSFLRIKSSLDQIISIFNIQDEEDLARLGTNRMAQAIPKLELLYNENKEATGFGFLDSPDNTPTKYIIYNDLYFEEYSEENWEVANSIEIAALEIFTSIGWVGLAVHIIFFVMLWMTVRKKRNANYFLSVVIAFAWFGIGGFEGLIRAQSLYLIGLTYGIVLLCNRPDRPREPQDLPLSYNDPYNTQA